MSFQLARYRVLPALAAVLLGACASTPPTTTTGPTTGAANGSEDSTAALKQRAQERWDLLIAYDAAKAWDYLTPGYRATITREKYGAKVNNRPMQWKSANVTKVDCAQPGNCQVYVAVTYSVLIGGGAGPITTIAPIKETWLFLHDQWYYLPGEDG